MNVMSNAAQTWMVRDANTNEDLGAIDRDDLKRYISESGIITDDALEAGLLDAETAAAYRAGEVSERYEGFNSGIVSGDGYGYPGVNIYCSLV